MKKKTIIVAIISIVALALITGGVYLTANWNKSLGESLSLPTKTMTSQELNTSTPTIEKDVNAPGIIQETMTPSITVTFAETKPKPKCGGPDLLYILAAGIDTKDPNYTYGLSDVMRVIRVDFVTPKVTVLTLPRDLEVKLPDIIESKKDELYNAKLNQAYFYGGPGMGYYDGPGGGMGLLARTLAYNYDLYVDNYIAVNMVAFEEIIDAMGGIDIYLPEPIDGRPLGMDDVDPYKQGQGYFNAGWNHLTGYDALSFVRIRSRYGDVERTDNQTLVLCAIQEKLNSPALINSVPKMIFSVLDDIQTDLSPAQIRQLICLLSELDNDNIQFVRFPDDWMVQGRTEIARLGYTFVWNIPVDKIREFCDEFETDSIPLAPEEGSSTCPVNPPKK